MPSCGGSTDTSVGASLVAWGRDEPLLERELVIVSSKAEILGGPVESAIAAMVANCDAFTFSAPKTRWKFLAFDKD